MPITFQVEEIKFVLVQKTNIRKWIQHILKLENKILGEVNYIFTSDEKVYKTNFKYLKHDTYTDIITFDYCEKNIVNSDIIISIERIEENAKKLKINFNEELRRVIIHGILHLCGYKDKTKKAAEIMRRKENWALELYAKII